MRSAVASAAAICPAPILPRLTVSFEHAIVKAPLTASPLAPEATSVSTASTAGSAPHPAAASVAVKHTTAWARESALRIARADAGRLE
ncbi:hypothetical protein SCE1572_24385 [Sorangium cellulosum So0157-2]|uniref:Uncharacterized protein n=1 Tax=Sorangium cellulosum So0157-2 TaxID=1254432 RepID=S4XVS9_SORCE|nr:hypothetical protein SCE1572_24385 [Sorangium cellulosum So0157-2]